VRILQLTSDWKWTGPAEPMLVLACALREAGHEVALGCPDAPDGEPSGLAVEAGRRGMRPVLRLDRGRGVRPWRDRRDLERVRGAIGCFDVVHVWHTRDHVLALRAVRSAPRAACPIVVRSLSDAAPLARWPWNRWLFGRGADGVACVSEATAAANASVRGGRPIAGILGAVEGEKVAAAAGRFTRAAARERVGLPAEAPVIAVVARVQRHRRFDLLFEAFSRLTDEHRHARLLLLGRGTHFDEVAAQPVAERDLADRVVMAGHRRDDYLSVLASADLLTYLVPGSDGSCRAVLEAAACGVPCVATRRGALPEIIADGETGVLIDEDPEALAEAWRQLIDAPAERTRLAENARTRARSLFLPARLASEVEALYEAAAASS